MLAQACAHVLCSLIWHCTRSSVRRQRIALPQYALEDSSRPVGCRVHALIAMRTRSVKCASLNQERLLRAHVQEQLCCRHHRERRCR
jgi:hypothetical protein